MSLYSTKTMLSHAKDNKYAIGHFNLNNLEFTQAILTAAQNENAPVILGVTEKTAKNMGGYKLIVEMVVKLIEEYRLTIPVALHLDHGSSFESCKQAIDAGFSSVMIDGSHFEIEGNIEITREVVRYAKKLGVSVEAELGRISGQEDDLVVNDVDLIYAIPSECEMFVRETGVNSLAPSLGSVHGIYKGEPKLNFEHMKEISKNTGVPLVLHGGSGIPEADIKKAISCGTSKINVNTENQIAYTQAIRETLMMDKSLYDTQIYFEKGKNAIVEVVQSKIRLFGSSNVLNVQSKI
ncbi:class II fructose-1,6-bisphosphate aldolase [Bacillus sp. FJAT-50079]|uniref:class II fructose-1,6-bisphosphate aldolase n=1 Tax=Bacillus sp. FJAT-50079 TaxID=2833577 RepID=UPI001BC8ECA7|nr:class II fructose-1,6-bisphosphate aldolase [Bacillus sp. FJAT-50079]MBS4208129.1 class II fructose-1,6-bisphosphate aldolase [Bacillus sp. FJAT-50079]